MKLYFYGASDGFPTQHGIIKDAQAALDHLVQRTDIDTSRIVVFGRSLGGAVGAVLARNNPDKMMLILELILGKVVVIRYFMNMLDGIEKVSAVILENTFTSILDMAGVMLPFLKVFIGKSGSKSPKVLNFVVRSPWNTIDVIGELDIKRPILFLSGLKDEMVPPSHMKMLYAKAAARNSKCLFVEFPTGMHMNTYEIGGVRYWGTIHEFLSKWVPERKDNHSSRVALSELEGR
ncbi:Alpha/beta hydrolase domain-containing protein wav2 [Orobanche gracilis]